MVQQQQQQQQQSLFSKAGTKEAHLLKAGHPPAVKAGGKRVAKKCLDESSGHGTPEKESKKSDKLRSLSTFNRMQQVNLLLSGPLDKLSHDFPETPVSVRHSKMRPSVEKLHSPRSFVIQQPRKC
ncbi:death-associated protein-like 1 [Gouania willdenowi]|uniref:Death-associated protein-like 1 n=1 Tax=Gouania willdenowi TaxID=441366 RepID=A0A8C5HZ83_GOUWI|nr:death-associated protein-like 1 [Gouania willdenowi]